MSTAGLGITFNDVGIGAALNQFALQVPLGQRSYAWEESHVRTLLEDFTAALASDLSLYFLGTIVLTHGAGPLLEVSTVNSDWLRHRY